MAQPKLTIKERLIKYNISLERYNNDTSRLLAAGFTQKQTDKLIVRGSSKNAVESVLNNYGILLGVLAGNRRNLRPFFSHTRFF